MPREPLWIPYPFPVWDESTFQELLSTGRLALLENHGLRSSILDYYAFKEASDWMYDLQSLEYRNAVRRRIDADTQLRIREDCDRSSPTCPVDLGGFETDAYLRWLANNPELAGDLTMVIEQYARGEAEYLPEVQARARGLIAAIETELVR